MPEVSKLTTDTDENSTIRSDAVSLSLSTLWPFQIAQAKLAMSKYQTEKEMSTHIKSFFDKKYYPNWHCVVGKDFASHMSYENKTFVFFYVGQLAFLIYKMT